jgi:diadenosine tetraphosphatase ApaH/serine/threonine PP2A family protein phosphatase
VINGVRFFNAGSAGKPRDGDPHAAWLLVDVEDDGAEITLHRVKYDVTSAATRIRTVEGLPDHFATDIETGGEANEGDGKSVRCYSRHGR